MTPMEHYREAEALGRRAEEWSNHIETSAVMRLLAQAQWHATLATVPESQYRPEPRWKAS